MTSAYLIFHLCYSHGTDIDIGQVQEQHSASEEASSPSSITAWQEDHRRRILYGPLSLWYIHHSGTEQFQSPAEPHPSTMVVSSARYGGPYAWPEVTALSLQIERPRS